MKSFTTKMLLKNLIKNSPHNLKKLKIKGLALNSREVKKGFIFFAVKGNQTNGENYINEAIKNGAIVIICSKSCKFESKKVNVIHQVMVYHLSKTSLVYYDFFFTSSHLDELLSLAQLPVHILACLSTRTRCPRAIFCCYTA